LKSSSAGDEPTKTDEDGSDDNKEEEEEEVNIPLRQSYRQKDPFAAFGV